MNLLFMAFATLALAQEMPQIIYFGGYGATSEQVKCWADGISFPDVEVSAIQYPPGASSGRNRDVEKLAAYKNLLKNIKANLNRKFQVAGHSSGSQYANNLVEWMLDQGVPAANINLVNLDGFRASESLKKRVQTTCWSATNGRTNSNNYDPSCRIYKAPHCKTKWCLHFSLVNRIAPSDLSGGSDFIRRGYGKKDCQTNTDWIETNPVASNQKAQGPAPGTP